AIPLFDLPHAEARALLAGGMPVYLPVNPVEYHGPHLSLHNDALISAGLIGDLHRAISDGQGWPLVVAASLELGVDPCPGPGTRDTPYGEVREIVIETCQALADLGARRVVLMTFHGSPLHALALEAGVRALEGRGLQAISPMNLLLQALLGIETEPYAEALAHIDDPAERRRMLAGLVHDFHAGFAETSLSLHYAP